MQINIKVRIADDERESEKEFDSIEEARDYILLLGNVVERTRKMAEFREDLLTLNPNF